MFIAFEIEAAGVTPRARYKTLEVERREVQRNTGVCARHVLSRTTCRHIRAGVDTPRDICSAERRRKTCRGEKKMVKKKKKKRKKPLDVAVVESPRCAFATAALPHSPPSLFIYSRARRVFSFPSLYRTRSSRVFLPPVRRFGSSRTLVLLFKLLAQETSAISPVISGGEGYTSRVAVSNTRKAIFLTPSR